MLFVTLFVTSLAAVAAPCLRYDVDMIKLTGKVTLKTFYGPPNYGESPATDARETQAILFLEKPICVHANPVDYYDAETNQSEVTLVPPSGVSLKDYASKHVTLQGTLFHSHTGHHHTPVLMQIARIERTHD